MCFPAESGCWICIVSFIQRDHADCLLRKQNNLLFNQHSVFFSPRQQNKYSDVGWVGGWCYTPNCQVGEWRSNPVLTLEILFMHSVTISFGLSLPVLLLFYTLQKTWLRLAIQWDGQGYVFKTRLRRCWKVHECHAGWHEKNTDFILVKYEHTVVSFFVLFSLSVSIIVASAFHVFPQDREKSS